MFNTRRTRHTRGFTLLEVLIAIAVLAAGLLAIAATLSKLSKFSTTSRYLGTQITLANEKLENLNQLPAVDAALTPGGGLGADVGPIAGVSYFDDVRISTSNGTILDNPDDPTAGAPPPPPLTPDIMVFHRRWVIEQDLPVIGVKRITVQITTPQTGSIADRGATFQTSMVRPGQ